MPEHIFVIKSKAILGSISKIDINFSKRKTEQVEIGTRYTCYMISCLNPQ